MILLLLLAVPALGALLVAFLPDRAARCAAVAVSAVTFGLSLGPLTGRHQAHHVVDPWRSVDFAWIPGLNVRFQLGVDGISWPLVVLTTLLVLLCALYSLKNV
ncbi:MAG: NADH-quinone oxidoreductase subunit, partial [Cryptosporangiaceae bacterium]|nr:NADH-quinone oxidoreductase subunit [Cryptosporangiaceae bacterium]